MNVVLDGEVLATADLLEEGRRTRARRVALLRVHLHDGPPIQKDLVARLRAIRVVGVDGVRHIGTVTRRGYQFLIPVSMNAGPSRSDEPMDLGNLPSVNTSIIGREADVAAIFVTAG